MHPSAAASLSTLHSRFCASPWYQPLGDPSHDDPIVPDPDPGSFQRNRDDEPGNEPPGCPPLKLRPSPCSHLFL
ncbi:hypothetical protein LX32DRAFT_40341 [Colletotrichum zoysiae]|uniref:Uncharacterized protein n=1 Tax=Colletotrichum zoysiae TaxID=1216348 RepID=A0AAD9HCP5_9PEZI|nr:hypothetical protein LX32DRAFT_40341 [Colletotrichum zoysiae]